MLPKSGRTMACAGCLLIAVATGLLASRAHAASTPATEPAVDHALDDSMWFDSSTSKIRPVKVSPATDDSLNRNSLWLPKPRKQVDRNA